MIKAEVIKEESGQGKGLTFKVTLTGHEESQFRSLANLVADNGRFESCLQIVFSLANQAANLVSKNKRSVY